MHRSLMQFNACKLKMRIVAALGERVSDVTQSCTSGRIMILVSQLLEWNGQPRGDTKKLLLGSSGASSSDRDHQLVPSVGVTININNDINSPPPGAQCCYDKFTGCNCGDPRLIYLHIFRCPLSRVMLVIITGEQKP